MLEIGTRQLNNWRLHEPPDFFPFCQPGVLSTRLHCSLVPRHHFRLPGRYRNQRQNFVKILICLHINFQKQILKGQLSINQLKSRSLDHNNYFSGAVFDLEIKSSAILQVPFCVPPFFEYLLFACLFSLELFLVVTFNSFCVVLF